MTVVSSPGAPLSSPISGQCCAILKSFQILSVLTPIEPEVKFENSIFRSALLLIARESVLTLILGRLLASPLSCDRDRMPPLGLLKKQLECAR